MSGLKLQAPIRMNPTNAILKEKKLKIKAGIMYNTNYLNYEN